jgi:hypothetical protein
LPLSSLLPQHPHSCLCMNRQNKLFSSLSSRKSNQNNLPNFPTWQPFLTALGTVKASSPII